MMETRDKIEREANLGDNKRKFRQVVKSLKVYPMYTIVSRHRDYEVMEEGPESSSDRHYLKLLSKKTKQNKTIIIKNKASF